MTEAIEQGNLEEFEMNVKSKEITELKDQIDMIIHRYQTPRSI
jgi:hypothetical protein